MTTEMKQKREELKSLSAGFKVLVKGGAIGSINEGLARYYAELGHKVLNSYSQWKEQGFQVKKGSKALLMWGEPKQLHKPDAQPKNEGEEEDKFFPLAYLFSNLQVERINSTNEAR